MKINILKEFKTMFFYKKKLINIILDHTNVNYTHKITLICVFLLILSFLFKFFPIIFMKFPPYRYFINIYDVYVKSKYLYIHVY